MTKWVVITFFTGYFNKAVCQTSFGNGALTASWFSFMSVRQEFTKLSTATPNVSVSSDNIVSYAGRIEYSRLLSDNFEVAGGVVAGSYPVDFIVSFDSSFLAVGYDFDDYNIDRYSSVYLGLSLGVNYYKRFNPKHSLSFGLRLNYIFFIPQWYSSGLSVRTDAATLRVYQARANMNPNEKAFISPEASIGYHYNFNKYFTPYISINGVFSNNYPIQGRSFTIYGKAENVEYTFKRRFLQLGAEIGVKLNLPNSKR